MEKDAIVHLESQAVALSFIQPKTADREMLVLPDGAQLVDIEKWQDRPYRHSGTYTTSRIQSFINYVNDHKECRTQIFLDDTNMVVQAVFDHFEAGGGPDIATGWGEHIAALGLQMTPEWRALRAGSRNSGHQLTQREFLDFMVDWAHALNFADSNGENISPATAYQSVQKLEVKKTNTAMHEDASHRVSRGKLEELDVRGIDGNLPAAMLMACSTHIGLKPEVIECRLMVLADNERVTLGYRINTLDHILDNSAEDFASQVKNGLDDIPLWLGNFSR